MKDLSKDSQITFDMFVIKDHFGRICAYFLDYGMVIIGASIEEVTDKIHRHFGSWIYACRKYGRDGSNGARDIGELWRQRWEESTTRVEIGPLAMSHEIGSVEVAFDCRTIDPPRNRGEFLELYPYPEPA